MAQASWFLGSNFWLQQELKESQCEFVCLLVRLVQVCLELSIFIILTQIVKLTSYELQAVSQKSFNSHLVSHHTVGALNTSSVDRQFKAHKANLSCNLIIIMLNILNKFRTENQHWWDDEDGAGDAEGAGDGPDEGGPHDEHPGQHYQQLHEGQNNRWEIKQCTYFSRKWRKIESCTALKKS